MAPVGRGCGSRAGQVWTYEPRLCCCPGEGQLASYPASHRMVSKAASQGSHQELKVPNVRLGAREALGTYPLRNGYTHLHFALTAAR